MNLPNKITIIRICLIPLMVLAFYTDIIYAGFIYAGIISAALFILASFTDFLDGYIARKHNLVTNMGKFLDPIADKVLVVTALFLIIESGLILAPYGAIIASLIVARELIISGFRQIAAANGIIISADMTGKVKAVFQDISMVMFILLKSFDQIFSGMLLRIYIITAYAAIISAVILTIWSGISYIVKNKKVLGGGNK